VTKALLMLSGGRSLPDLLVLKYLRPDIAINITTTQGRANALYFQQFSQAHFGLTMEVPPAINPFDEQEIKNACMTALQRFPAAEWTMHITTSPKVVGIYAHDIAREYSIPCWFLDTDGMQVVSLVRQSEKLGTERFFKVTVEEYMQAYGRTYEIPKSRAYRQKAESWSTIASTLVHEPVATQLLMKAVREVQQHSLEIILDTQAEQLIQQLAALGALSITGRNADRLSCTIANSEQLEFLKGDWLEVYVWKEMSKTHIADDCQWGYKIKTDLPANELDLVFTHNARLLIAECKTSRNPFATDYLYKLHSVADLVGGNYVRQVFITNCPHPKRKDNQFDNFIQQAKLRRISVIAGEQLPTVGAFLQQEIEATGRSH
jgi:hypothetical protein